jgi:hypothetical protein
MVLYITKVKRREKFLKTYDLRAFGGSYFDLLDGPGDVSGFVSYAAHLYGTYFDY